VTSRRDGRSSNLRRRERERLAVAWTEIDTDQTFNVGFVNGQA
jgi:hypothetical protein